MLVAEEELARARPLDRAERMFLRADRESSMNFVVMAEGCEPLDPERIRRALKTLQEEVALLRVAIVETADGAAKFVEHRRTIQLVVAKGDTLESAVEVELATPFRVEQGPLMRCRYLPEGSIVIIALHHSIADGAAGVFAIRRLLELVRDGAASSGQPRSTAGLPAPLHDRYPDQLSWLRQPAKVARALAKLQASMIQVGPMSPPPPWFDRATRKPTLPVFSRIVLGREVGRQLVRRTRVERTTLHGVFCAAMLTAWSHVIDVNAAGAESRVVLLTIPTDLRAKLADPPCPSVMGTFSSNILHTYRIDAGEGAFWNLAREVPRRRRDQAEADDASLFFFSPAVEHLLAGERGIEGPVGVSVSNIGRIDEVNGFPAARISGCIAPERRSAFFCAASTYGDEILVNVVHDEGRIPPATAQVVLRRLASLLQGKLTPGD